MPYTYYYTSADEILETHDRIIFVSGGASGSYPDALARLQSILDTRYYISTIYKCVFSRAAYLIYLINKGHVFIDGNKRTSMAIGNTFLNLNGFYLRAEQSELVKYALMVAESASEDKDKIIKRLHRWLRKRCFPAN